MRIVLLQERKENVDENRVLFSPTQLAAVKKQYPNFYFAVEASTTRCFSDKEYQDKNINIVTDISTFDLLLGIKEIPSKYLIPNKNYFFFSHTTKMQPHNKGYLQQLKDSGISFFDYENFTDHNENRLVAFGKCAGQIGAYHTIRTFGLKNKRFNLPKPHLFDSIEELIFIAKNTNLPPVKIAITGTGNVGSGSSYFLEAIGIHRVAPADFLNLHYTYPVFTQLQKKDYLFKNHKGDFNLDDFIQYPESYHSDFYKYAKQAEVLIAGHYYHKGMPLFFTKQEIQNPGFKINTIADISCDVFAPLPTCLRPSVFNNPIYGYDTKTGKEIDFNSKESIAVMAVDNLPSELPKTSSIDFGNQFINRILPYLNTELNHPILQKSQVLNNGVFTKKYSYLDDFLESKKTHITT